MNLAEQVRQVHELKKDYELALKNIGKPYTGFAMADNDFEGHFYRVITGTMNDAVYFLDVEDDYDDEYLKHVDFFACKDKTVVDAEKLAQQHGFTTELVNLEFEVPIDDLNCDGYSWGDSEQFQASYGRSPTIKALKITWGA